MILYNVCNIHVHYLYVVKGWILQSSRINIVWLKSVFLFFCNSSLILYKACWCLSNPWRNGSLDCNIHSKAEWIWIGHHFHCLLQLLFSSSQQKVNTIILHLNINSTRIFIWGGRIENKLFGIVHTLWWRVLLRPLQLGIIQFKQM